MSGDEASYNGINDSAGILVKRPRIFLHHVYRWNPFATDSHVLILNTVEIIDCSLYGFRIYPLQVRPVISIREACALVTIINVFRQERQIVQP